MQTIHEILLSASTIFTTNQKYSWTGKFAHLFCSTCGTSCMSKSLDPNFYADFKAVNVRTFEGVDLKKLRVKEVDGKSFNPDA